jgi:DNA-binding NtrC family response regulator
MIKRQCIILVADRNPRIRDFIERELNLEGYRVFTLENADQLESWFDRKTRLDAVVIDPTMPGFENENQLERLLGLRPDVPVVFHCLSSDRPLLADYRTKVGFVEKSGHSVDALKQVIGQLVCDSVNRTLNETDK